MLVSTGVRRAAPPADAHARTGAARVYRYFNRRDGVGQFVAKRPSRDDLRVQPAAGSRGS